MQSDPITPTVPLLLHPNSPQSPSSSHTHSHTQSINQSQSVLEKDEEYPTYTQDEPIPDEEEEPTSTIRKFVDSFLPSIFGLTYITLGVYTVYSKEGNQIVISRSTDHITEIRGAFIALANAWTFIALLLVGSLIERIRSEEWYRRLMSSRGNGDVGATFAHLDHVSSNLGGTMTLALDLMGYFSKSSRPFKWIVASALLSLGLNELAPSILQVVPGWYSVGQHNLAIPAIPPLSIHANLSQSFGRSRSTTSELSTVYIFAALNGANIGIGRYFPDAVVPLSSYSPSEYGEDYDTDIVYFAYDCAWRAPTIWQPQGGNLTEVINNRGTYGSDGYAAYGRPPFYPGTIDLLDSVYKLGADNQTYEPSFDGTLMIVAQSAPVDAVQLNRGWSLDLSSAPTSSVPTAWSPYQQEFATLNENTITTTVSMAICVPEVIIQSQRIFIQGEGVLKYNQPLQDRVGNIDDTQLKIAMTDSFHDFSDNYPLAFLVTPFNAQDLILNNERSHIVYTPKNASDIASAYNNLMQNSLLAYLDNSPFGQMIVKSEGTRLGLVLQAQKEFLWVVTGMYAVLAIVGAIVMIVNRKEKRIARQLSIGKVFKLVGWGGTKTFQQQGHMPMMERRLNGLRICEVATDVAGGAGVTATEEDRVYLALRTSKVSVRAFPSATGPVNTLSLDMGAQIPRTFLEREIRGLRRLLYFLTPVVGGAFVALGAYAYTHDVVLKQTKWMTDNVLVLQTLFTIAIGVWRTLALGGASNTIREVRSEEWTRLSERAIQAGASAQHVKVKSIMEDVSTNRTSIFQLIRYTLFYRPSNLISGYYRLALVSFLVMTTCSIVSHGAIQLHLRPVPTGETTLTNVNSFNRSAATVYTALGNASWASERALVNIPGASYDGLTTSTLVGHAYAYLENELDSALTVKYPSTKDEGLFLLQPPETIHFRNSSLRYFTDVGSWKYECSWVAPTIQTWSEAVNSTQFITVEMPEKNIKGLMSPPWGYPWFHDLQRPSKTDGDEENIFSGLFAWTLFGGGAGSKVNLDNVPHSDVSTDWQNWIKTSLIPTYNPGFVNTYVEYPTKVSSLVCDPHIKIQYNSSVLIHNETVTVRHYDDKDKAIGNLDAGQIAYLMYFMSSRMGTNTLGSFRDFLPIGALSGLAALEDAAETNSTRPRNSEEIGKTLNSLLTSHLKFFAQTEWGNVTTLSSPVTEKFAVDASLPQLIASGVLFAILSIFVAIFQLRTKLRKFTLAGILLAGGKDLSDWPEKS